MFLRTLYVVDFALRWVYSLTMTLLVILVRRLRVA